MNRDGPRSKINAPLTSYVRGLVEGEENFMIANSMLTDRSSVITPMLRIVVSRIRASVGERWAGMNRYSATVTSIEGSGTGNAVLVWSI